MLMRKNKDELQEECVTRGLSPQGTKRTIVERLMLHEKVTIQSHQWKE